MSKRGYENYGNDDPAPKRAAPDRYTTVQRTFRPMNGLNTDTIGHISSFLPPLEFHAERVHPTMGNIRRAVAMLPRAKDERLALDTLTRTALRKVMSKKSVSDAPEVVRFLAKNVYKTKFDIVRIMNTIQADHTQFESTKSSVFPLSLLEKLIYIYNETPSESNNGGYKFVVDAFLGADTGRAEQFANVARVVKDNMQNLPFDSQVTTRRPGRLMEKLRPESLALLFQENIIHENVVLDYAYLKHVAPSDLNNDGVIKRLNKKIKTNRPAYLKHSTYTGTEILLLSQLAAIYMQKPPAPDPLPEAPNMMTTRDLLYLPPCWSCGSRDELDRLDCEVCRCEVCEEFKPNCDCWSPDPYF